MNIEDKILTLVKYADKEDPMEYVSEILKEYCIEKANECIETCSKCNLCNHKIKSVSYGNVNARILVVGESVSEEQYSNEDSGITLPLLDSDGELFDKALDILNANKDALYITNCVNCFPGKRKDTKKTKIVSLEEREACKTHLDKIIDILKPTLIITLGAVATNGLSVEKINISEHRGKMFKYKDYDVMCTYHPALFREGTHFSEAMLEEYKCDFLEDLYAGFKFAKDNDSTCDIGDIQLDI